MTTKEQARTNAYILDTLETLEEIEENPGSIGEEVLARVLARVLTFIQANYNNTGTHLGMIEKLTSRVDALEQKELRNETEQPTYEATCLECGVLFNVCVEIKPYGWRLVEKTGETMDCCPGCGADESDIAISQGLLTALYDEFDVQAKPPQNDDLPF